MSVPTMRRQIFNKVSRAKDCLARLEEAVEKLEAAHVLYTRDALQLSDAECQECIAAALAAEAMLQAAVDAAGRIPMGWE